MIPPAPAGQTAELRRLTEETDRQLDRWRDGDGDAELEDGGAATAPVAAPARGTRP